MTQSLAQHVDRLNAVRTDILARLDAISVGVDQRRPHADLVADLEPIVGLCRRHIASIARLRREHHGRIPKAVRVRLDKDAHWAASTMAMAERWITRGSAQ